MVKYSRQHCLDAALLQAALKRQSSAQPIGDAMIFKQQNKHDIDISGRIYGAT